MGISCLDGKSAVMTDAAKLNPTEREQSDSLRSAYSAGKAASFAYIGHAGSLKEPEEKAAVQQIEQDEWNYRRNVLEIMQQFRFVLVSSMR